MLFGPNTSTTYPEAACRPRRPPSKLRRSRIFASSSASDRQVPDLFSKMSLALCEGAGGPVVRLPVAFPPFVAEPVGAGVGGLHLVRALHVVQRALERRYASAV